MPPTDGRTSSIIELQQLLDALDERGIDGRALIDCVFTQDLARVIALAVVLPAIVPADIFGDDMSEDLLTAAWKPFEGWPEALLEGIADDATTAAHLRTMAQERGETWAKELVRKVLRDAVPMAQRWLSGLSIDALLARQPPTTVELRALRSSSPPETSDDQLWIVDRFTTTYLADWDHASLLKEFRYQHGECEPPREAEAMRTRVINVPDLNEAIAYNAASGNEGRRSGGRTVDNLVGPALQRLEEGEPRLAAALFDAHRTIFPDDARAHNNYDFCMMPVDAELSFAALQHAAALGLHLEPVNVANRMLLLRQFARPATALEIAERLANSTAWERAAYGHLWDRHLAPTEWRTNGCDPRSYVAELAAEIAAESRDELALRTWRARVNQLAA